MVGKQKVKAAANGLAAMGAAALPLDAHDALCVEGLQCLQLARDHQEVHNLALAAALAVPTGLRLVTADTPLLLVLFVAALLLLLTLLLLLLLMLPCRKRHCNRAADMRAVALAAVIKAVEPA